VDPLSQHRLKWKCRRGLLELDLVLQHFVEHRMAAADAAALDGLLELQDLDLWAIVSGRSEAYPPKFRGIVAQLRAA